MKKSQDHTRLKRLAAISLVLVMCLSSLAVLAPPAAAESETVNNDRTGDRVVFHQNYSEMLQVPDNVFLSYAQSPLLVNTSLTYDYMNPALKFTGGKDAKGQLYIAGLTPAIITNISLEAEMSRDDQNSVLFMHIGDARLAFYLYDGSPDYGRVKSYYFDPSKGEVSQFSDNINLSSMDETSWRFTVTVQFNGVTNSNIIYIDGVQVLETPAYSLHHPGLAQPYSSFSSPLIYIWFWFPNMAISEGQAQVRIYSVTQTVPDYQYVTPIGNAKIQPFGLDGPHGWQYIRNGISYLQSTGGRGTIWADVLTQFAGGYSSEDLAELQALLADGWELGIHFSESLSSLSMEDAVALMIEEYNVITQLFGQSPTSWCSLGNAEEPSHAEYAYHNLGMVWRNGYNGVGNGITGIRAGLYDIKWYFHEAASEAGLINPIYTHQTDRDPAGQYAISYSNFTIWVDNYAAAGVTIVPWIDYWQTAQNTGHTEISGLRAESGKSLSFTIDNIGGKSRVFVAAPFAEIVVDGDGNKVSFEEVDGGIIMEVEAGEYQVMTMSAYRQDQVDRAMSPLYAAIPLVLVLGVIGGLFAMIGRVRY